MSFLSELFSSGAKDLITSVSGGLDAIITSDQERLQAKNEMERIINERIALMEQSSEKYESEITTRWTSDNAGNFLTKSIRPLTLGFLLLTYTILVILDSITSVGFDVKDSYISLLEMLMLAVFSAYFGLKSFERYKAKVKD